MNLEKIKIYRITHISNIPHILRFGITHKDSPNANKSYMPIGDVKLIGTRENKMVPVDNGDLLKLGDLIPFYFWIKMPMLYVIQHGGNHVGKVVLPEDIIYISCKLNEIIKLENKFYFSDGHAMDAFTLFYDHYRIKELPNIIDWDSVKELHWSGEDKLALKRKKQAEFLIYPEIPAECLDSFGCYNEKIKLKLIAMGINENKIFANHDFYF
jgi:hypothetical protein